MTDLRARSTEDEIMDRPDTPPADYARALADLAKVNAMTMTHRPILRWIQAQTATLPVGQKISVLDVACGHGDLLRAIHRWGSARGLRMDLRGLDRNLRSTAEAQAATPADMTITWITADVFGHVPLPAVDFIVTSQFTHHLDNDHVAGLLIWLDTNAKRGWLIADLQRHWLPFAGFRLLAWVMGWHRIVRLDGTTSIARGFHRAEWRALLGRAGVVGRITWQFPFRYCIASTR